MANKFLVYQPGAQKFKKIRWVKNSIVLNLDALYVKTLGYMEKRPNIKALKRVYHQKAGISIIPINLAAIFEIASGKSMFSSVL